MNLDDIAYYERRPWMIWKPAVEKARLFWPDVIITEAGTDLGPHILPNGYRNPAIGSEQQAAYIRDMPNGYFKEAVGVCLFGLGLTDDWVDKGFEMLGDDMVLDATAETNEKETPMPEMQDDERLLRDMWRRAGVATFAPTNAFWRYCLDAWRNAGRAIVPLPSPDGNFEVHSLADYIVAYTQPILWIRKGDPTWTVREGNPYRPLA